MRSSSFQDGLQYQLQQERLAANDQKSNAHPRVQWRKLCVKNVNVTSGYQLLLSGANRKFDVICSVLR